MAAVLSLSAACVGLVTATPAAASFHGTPTTAAVGDRIGSLKVVDAFLPQPASPDVAAIYLTVKNSGSRPDALVAVSSAAAADSMLMTENANGTMGLLRELRVPAHGQASLVPGRDHLMLERPHDTLAVGQHVTVTLRFEHAGELTISVPVVPLSRILEHGRT
jgi:periplasmic copper chaperone A